MHTIPYRKVGNNSAILQSGATIWAQFEVSKEFGENLKTQLNSQEGSKKGRVCLSERKHEVNEGLQSKISF